LALTPVFYVLLRKLSGGKQLTDRHGKHPHTHGPEDNDGGHGGTTGASAKPGAKVPEPAFQE
jgi:multidrug efflux pump